MLDLKIIYMIQELQDNFVLFMSVTLTWQSYTVGP